MSRILNTSSSPRAGRPLRSKVADIQYLQWSFIGPSAPFNCVNADFLIKLHAVWESRKISKGKNARCGGGGRIRTHGRHEAFNGFQGRRFRPLSHPSAPAISQS